MVAYAKEHPIAEMTEAAIARIQALEKDFGVIPGACQRTLFFSPKKIMAYL